MVATPSNEYANCIAAVSHLYRPLRITDAAITLPGTAGARDLIHPQVDVQAEAAAGTTSFSFRTRKALLQGAAERLTEPDLDVLARRGMQEAIDGSAGPRA